jgi:Ca2+-binding RTX toxin-like protein
MPIAQIVLSILSFTDFAFETFHLAKYVMGHPIEGSVLFLGISFRFCLDPRFDEFDVFLRPHRECLTVLNRRTKRSIRVSPIDSLEPRRLLAAVAPTTYEQYMLELVNRARLDPVAEATRNGISLTEGLPSGAISTAAKQPLAGNFNLNDAARTHANWLISNSLFQHSGLGGSNAQQRMAAAGYVFSGTYGSAENLALTLGSSLGDITSRIETLFRNLFVDNTVVGRSHRTNLLNPSAEEMGSGVSHGNYTYNGGSWYGIVANQNFAYTAGNPFITGVAYTDLIRADNFYTPGEALPAVTIKATSADNSVYTTTSNDAGGYSLRVPTGIYTITATWNGKVINYQNVVVGAENVKRDFKQANFAVATNPPTNPVPPTNLNATLSNGLLSVNGTSAADTIEIVREGANFKVRVGNLTGSYASSLVNQIYVDARAGDDFVSFGEDVIGATVVGGEGDDTVLGTANADTLYGNDGDDSMSSGGGNDFIYGGAGDDNINTGSGRNYAYGEDGNDRLNGSGGVDKLYGQGGNDRLYGQGGDDFLDGGSNVDRLYGGIGNDTLNGGSSNDRLYGEGGNDLLIGFKGNDCFRGGVGYDTILDREAGEIFEEIEVG